jgi:uncharacterized protein
MPDESFIPRTGPASSDGLAAEFYAHCARGELRLQRCAVCRRWRHPPRVRCAQCGSADWQWEATAGRGAVYTWTVVHQALVPMFAEDLPYAVAVVELDEGPRLVTAVRGIAPQALTIGLRVEVAFAALHAAAALHWFRPCP